MLVLSRKIGDKIFIGKDVEIMVVEIDRGRVKIGITAPKDTPILRDDLKERIDKEKRKGGG